MIPTHCIFCNNTYSCSIVITIQWLLDCLLSFVCPDFNIVFSIFVDLLLLFLFSFHSNLLKSFLWLLLKAFTIGWWKFLCFNHRKQKHLFPCTTKLLDTLSTQGQLLCFSSKEQKNRQKYKQNWALFLMFVALQLSSLAQRKQKTCIIIFSCC